MGIFMISYIAARISFIYCSKILVDITHHGTFSVYAVNEAEIYIKYNH